MSEDKLMISRTDRNNTQEIQNSFAAQNLMEENVIF